jgi:hypothetical protein
MEIESIGLPFHAGGAAMVLPSSEGVSHAISVSCSLLPLFFSLLSFIFKDLQPLFAKDREVG